MNKYRLRFTLPFGDYGDDSDEAEVRTLADELIAMAPSPPEVLEDEEGITVYATGTAQQLVDMAFHEHQRTGAFCSFNEEEVRDVLEPWGDDFNESEIR